MLGWLFKGMFCAEQEKNYGFVVENYSNAIYADNPNEITVELTEKTYGIRFVVSVIQNDQAQQVGSMMTATVSDQQGTVFATESFSAEQIAGPAAVTVNAQQQFGTGEQVILRLECDAPTEETGYRIAMGSSLSNNIVCWKYNGIEDTVLTPGISILCGRISLRRVAIYLCLCGLITLSTLLPIFIWVKKRSALLGYGFFVGSSICVCGCLQFLQGKSVSVLSPWILLAEFLCVLSVQMFFLTLTQRTGRAMLCSNALMVLYGLAAHTVVVYTGVPCSPVTSEFYLTLVEAVQNRLMPGRSGFFAVFAIFALTVLGLSTNHKVSWTRKNRFRIAFFAVLILLACCFFCWEDNTQIIFILRILPCPATVLLAAAAAFRKKKREPSKPRARLFLLLLFNSVLTVYWVEFLGSSFLLEKSPGLILCNILVVLAVQFLAFALIGKLTVSVAVANGLFTVAGIINHFVMQFRGNCIALSDIFVIGAAINVMGGMKYHIGVAIVYSVVSAIASVFLTAQFSVCLKTKSRKYALGTRLGSAAASAVLLLFTASPVSTFVTRTQVSLLKQDMSCGLCWSIMQNVSNLKMQKPEGYSEAQTLAWIRERLNRTDETQQATQSTVKPNIVLIMNESLADLSMTCNLDTNKDPLEYIHSLQQDEDQSTYVGLTSVPVYGAYTANSEMEAVTGYSMLGFSAGTIPYSQYFNQKVPSFGSYVKAQGYETTFLHPGNAQTYNRQNVYTQFGFDTPFGDVPGKDEYKVHWYAEDRILYKEVLNRLENSEDPQFIFALTIQNHSGYDFDFDYEEPVYQKDMQVDENVKQLNNYLSDINMSDQAFRYLTEELAKSDTPTIVLMFGDHLPPLPNEIIGQIIKKDGSFEGGYASQYLTPCVIWANYELDTTDLPAEFSTNYISAILAKYAELPLSGWQQYLLEMMEQYPVCSVNYVKNAAGEMVEDADFSDYLNLQYLVFHEKYDKIEEFFE